MLGRLENMTIVEDWRMNGEKRQKRLDLFGAFALGLAIIAIVSAMTWLLAGTARADTDAQITWQGRTEKAQCSFEYIDPVVETCLTESWLCKIQGGVMECQTKR